LNIKSTTMTKAERFRRVVILCGHFMRNLAYHRIGMQHPVGWATAPLKPTADFWRTASGNFLDICTLEWCKLLGDPKGLHDWRNVVSDVAGFRKGLLQRLNMDEAGFEDYRLSMRDYRDTFVAHLDSDRTMNVPDFHMAKSSVEFYHAYVVENEAEPGDLRGLPDTAEKLRLGFEQCEKTARDVYERLTEI